MTSDRDPNSYAELGGRTYDALIEAIATANAGALDYAQAMWDVFAPPVAVPSPDTFVREQAERMDAAVALTIGALEANGRLAANLTRDLGAIAARANLTNAEALRGLADVGASNLAFLRDAAAAVQAPPRPVSRVDNS